MRLFSCRWVTIMTPLCTPQLNPYPAKLIHLNFQSLKVVSRYHDPQPQVVENDSYLFTLRPSI